MGSIEAERNRNRRRDKQYDKRRSGMRVDDAARDFAIFKKRMAEKTKELGWNVQGNS